MPAQIKSKKQEEKQELEQNKKIKPELQKFVVDLQRNKAAEVAKEKKKDDEFLLSQDDVINRCGQLATMALLRDRLWQKVPPYLEMTWTRSLSSNPQLMQEMHADISGFAMYLLREYNNYLKFRSLSHGYANPLEEKNLMFFWQKFNADLKLLIEAEKRRVAAGNKSLIIETKSKPEIITDVTKDWKN